MYTLTMSQGTDEAFAAEISVIKDRYSAKMKEATSYLTAAEVIDSQIKTIYVSATNFLVVEDLSQQIQVEIDERILSL
ncbi:hypothetical protein D3C86_1801090 [compost metagenome]